jgi:hypothetical protein
MREIGLVADHRLGSRVTADTVKQTYKTKQCHNAGNKFLVRLAQVMVAYGSELVRYNNYRQLKR